MKHLIYYTIHGDKTKKRKRISGKKTLQFFQFFPFEMKTIKIKVLISSSGSLNELKGFIIKTKTMFYQNIKGKKYVYVR